MRRLPREDRDALALACRYTAVFMRTHIHAIARRVAARGERRLALWFVAHSLVDAGAKHFYISNLPIARAQAVLSTILAKAGLTT